MSFSVGSPEVSSARTSRFGILFKPGSDFLASDMTDLLTLAYLAKRCVARAITYFWRRETTFVFIGILFGRLDDDTRTCGLDQPRTRSEKGATSFSKCSKLSSLWEVKFALRADITSEKK